MDIQNKNRTDQMRQFIGFSAGTNQYMLPILNIREIITMPDITALPHLPSYIKGITNLRGTVIPIISLKNLLDPESGNDTDSTVIVITAGKVLFGIIVREITGVININESEISPPDRFVNNESDFVEGVAKINNSLIILLNTKKLLPLHDAGLLEDSIIDVKESADGASVEVTREVSTIGGKVTVKELHDAKNYFSGKFAVKDPRNSIINLMIDFLEALSSGETQKMEEALDKLIQATDSDIFKEVGRITRKLHDSIENLRGAVDSGLDRLSRSDVPNAVDKLQFVISKTEDAANRTMEIIERYFEESPEVSSVISRIKGHDEEVSYLRTFKEALDNDVTSILTAQQYQDITGQNIKKVIDLVSSIEKELLALITKFGSQTRFAADTDDHSAACETVPLLHEDSRAKITQSDVEALLNNFGF